MDEKKDLNRNGFQNTEGGISGKRDKKHLERQLFGEMPVMKALLQLAGPTIVGQIILVVYNMADTFFIGLSGDDAMLSAVTVCMPAFMFLSAIANLFGVGGASVVARALGTKDKKKAHRTCSFAFWGCLAATLCYALGVFLLTDPFISLLGGIHPEVHAYARDYAINAIVIGGAAASMSILFSHLIRAEGHALIASAGISLGGVLNMILDPVFMFRIFSPGQEVHGAAVATALSNVGAFLFFSVFIASRERKKTVLRFKLGRKMLRPDVAGAVISAGLPACVMTLFENISYAVLDKRLAAFGTEVQAGIGVAKKINMLAHSIVRGITQGALPLIAFNYASGNRERMRRSFLYACGLAVATGTVCMAVNLMAADRLTGFFIGRASASRTYSIRFLRILTVGAPFSALAYMFISFFQAVGKGSSAFLLAVFRKGLLDIPMMFLLGMRFPVYGTVAATPVTDVICCACALLMGICFFRKFRENAGKSIGGVREMTHHHEHV